MFRRLSFLELISEFKFDMEDRLAGRNRGMECEKLIQPYKHDRYFSNLEIYSSVGLTYRLT